MININNKQNKNFYLKFFERKLEQYDNKIKVAKKDLENLLCHNRELNLKLQNFEEENNFVVQEYNEIKKRIINDGVFIKIKNINALKEWSNLKVGLENKKIIITTFRGDKVHEFDIEQSKALIDIEGDINKYSAIVIRNELRKTLVNLRIVN